MLRKLFRDFITSEDGLGTVEIVIILAVLVGLAILFRKAIIKFTTDIMAQFFTESTGATTGVGSDSGTKKVLDSVGATATPIPTN